MDACLPNSEQVVAFLSRPGSYPNGVQDVEIRQTHLSWIFLAGDRAWKMKKPVRTAYVDFITPEARRRNCEMEVQLNRRLADGVYYGVIPVNIDRKGALQLGGHGTPVEWLVSMRRLPAERMLDTLIIRGSVSLRDLSSLASTLTAFYKHSPPVVKSAPAYREGLVNDLLAAQRELSKAEYGLHDRRVKSVITTALELVYRRPAIFDARLRAGKIVEGHGDLRPEHICLEDPPVVIDCLEFNRELRTLDIVSEMSFLGLECERLGAGEVGDYVMAKYSEHTGDRPPRLLLRFYKAFHACVRAKVAVQHLADETITDREHWLARTAQYLELADIHLTIPHNIARALHKNSGKFG